MSFLVKSRPQQERFQNLIREKMGSGRAIRKTATMASSVYTNIAKQHREQNPTRIAHKPEGAPGELSVVVGNLNQIESPTVR